MSFLKSGVRPAAATKIGSRLHFAIPGNEQSRVFALLLGFLCIVFLIGGGSRDDVQSLAILRPLAVIVCGLGLITARAEHFRKYRFLMLMAACVTIFVGLHLIPLPPGLWESLPGRATIIQIDRIAGIDDIWRPLTMTPAAGANAFYALFVPLAVLILAIQLDADHLHKLILPILVIGILSGVLGVMQVAGDPKGPLYLYRITNNGASVGLFSNRNHQAVMLLSLFPVMALFASRAMKTESAIKMRLALAIGVSVMFVPLILVTGSRLGVILGILAFACGWLIFQKPEATGVRRRTEKKNYTVAVVAALGVILLVLITVLASRAEALNRLVNTNLMEENRVKAWGLAIDIAWKNFPFGSGSGSFVPMFQQVEPMSFLSPNYFNHAHNDWIEVMMTFGLPGMALLTAAVVGYFRGVRPLIGKRRISTSNLKLARVGAAIVLIFGLASLVDYPLRTPSLSCLFVLACCWMYVPVSVPLSSGNGRGN